MLNLDHVEKLLSKLTIRDRDGKGRVPFNLNPNQRLVMQELKKWQAKGKPLWAIVDKSRRVGVSALTDALLMCHALEKDMAEALIVAHQAKSSQALFQIPKMLVKGIPVPGIDTSNQNKIVFPHDHGDSTLTIATAGSVVGGRGITLSALHGSEVGYWVGADSFASLLPAVSRSQDSIIILESTANGMSGIGETFFAYWNAAVEGRNDFCPIFLTHLDDPACRNFNAVVHDIGKGDIGDYEKEMVALMKKRKLSKKEQQERISWVRSTLETQCQGISAMLEQEFPLCVTADTRVSTEQGLIQIIDAGTAKISESGLIDKWSAQPPSEIWEMETRYGRILRGTHDHPVATPDGFIGISKLRPGQIIDLRAPMFASSLHRVDWHPIPGTTSSVLIDESWGKFLGYFMGDGSWYKGVTSIVCDGKDTDVVEDAAVLMEKLVSRPIPRVISKVKGRKGALELRSSCKASFESFKKLGIIHSLNEAGYKRKVHVPECIFRSSRSVVKQFLSALFECDGSVAHTGQVRFGSSKLDFIRDVQLLLLGFGINSHIVSNPKITGTGYTYVFYALNLSNEGSLKFHDEIGFIGQRKRGLRRSKAILYSKIPQFHDYVAIVRSTGECDVTYDFTVVGEHVFSANGILTHNTPMMSFVSTGMPAFERAEMTYAESCVQEPKAIGVFDSQGDQMPGLWRDAGDGDWHIWEFPLAGHHYYLGADAAAGEELGESGQTRPIGDFSSIYIWNGETGEMAAKMAGRISPEYLADEINKAGRYYNKAMASVELTGNLGRWSIVRLRDKHHYPNFYRWKGRDDYIGKRNMMANKSGIGWDTNPATRELMFSAFKTALREGRIRPRSRALVNQMSQCSRIEGFKWALRRGFDDELCAALIGWIAREQWGPPMQMGGRVPEDASGETPMINRIRVQDDYSGQLRRHVNKVMAYKANRAANDRLNGV